MVVGVCVMDVLEYLYSVSVAQTHTEDQVSQHSSRVGGDNEPTPWHPN